VAAGADGVAVVRALRRAAPWLLCAVSLSALVLNGWLTWGTEGSPGAEDFVRLDTVLVGLAAAGIPVVGAVLAARLPGNLYGWLWCAIGLNIAVVGAVAPVTAAAGGSLWVAALADGISFAILLPLLTFAVLLFPTGRLPGPRWRWLARAVVLAPVPLILVGPFIPVPDEPANETPWAVQGTAGDVLLGGAVAWVFMMFGLGLAAVWALLVRYRRAGPVERQQLAWFRFAAVLTVVLLTLNAVGLLPGRVFSLVLLSASLALFPAAVLVAVSRYRLYEIDRIVSRTVSYGLLTGGLAVLYLGLVALLRPLLEPITGGSSLAVAGSTLAVAAAFNPARRRLQDVVDRRFDRARYDAALAVEAYAARLRSEVDLDEVLAGLRDTVTATVAPGRVAVWLRAPTGSRS
jgi:hypothetical protein